MKRTLFCSIVLLWLITVLHCKHFLVEVDNNEDNEKKILVRNFVFVFVVTCISFSTIVVPFRRKNEINQIADETEEVEDIKEIIDEDTGADGTYYKH